MNELETKIVSVSKWPKITCLWCDLVAPDRLAGLKCRSNPWKIGRLARKFLWPGQIVADGLYLMKFMLSQFLLNERRTMSGRSPKNGQISDGKWLYLNVGCVGRVGLWTGLKFRTNACKIFEDGFNAIRSTRDQSRRPLLAGAWTPPETVNEQRLDERLRRTKEE